MAAKFVIGVVIGAVLATGGVAGGLRAEGVVDEPQATTTTTLRGYEVRMEPDWLGEGGSLAARFESTVVVAKELDVADDEVRLKYELASLGQVPLDFAPSVLPAAVPELWRLTTTSGVTVEATTSLPRIGGVFNVDPQRPSATVRFELGTPVEAGDVAAVEITGWRMATPVQIEFSIEAISGESVGLFDGSTVSVVSILEQRSSTIVSFDVDTPLDPWRQRADQGFGPSSQFYPASVGWRSSSTSEGGFQLTWGGDVLPPTIEIEWTTVAWFPVSDAEPLVVFTGTSS